MGRSGVVLYDRLFCQVNRRRVGGLRLLLLLLMLVRLLLSLRIASRFGTAAGFSLPIPGDKTPKEPRMIRSGPRGR